jgi:tetratricopeptide (TPR) repeat protein
MAHLSRTDAYVDVPTIRWQREPFPDRATWGQSVHAALVRQAIEELEAALFLKPDELATKALLASACLVQEPGTWDPRRAVGLYEEIQRADPAGAFGLNAQRKIPLAWASALNQAQIDHLADERERAQACVKAYLKLAEQSADRGELEESLKAALDAEFWSFDYDVTGSLACLRINVQRAARADPAKLPVDSDGLHQTAHAIAWTVRVKHERAGECRELLRRWSTHASPHLRFLGLTNLGEIEERVENFKLAAENFAAAVAVCQATKARWFTVREERARVSAAAAYLKAKDTAAGIAVLQPQIDALKAGTVLDSQTGIALADLYEATGQFDRAIEVYRPIVRRYPNDGAAVDHLRALIRAHPEFSDSGGGGGKVEFEVREKGAQTFLCAGEGMIWSCNDFEVSWFDPATGRGGMIHRSATELRVRALTWTANHWLWAATRENGLWRLDTRTGATSLAQADPWVKVDGLPDANVTSMAPGDDGELYVGVGVPTPGNGAAIKGGVVRIDAKGQVHPLDQSGAPRLAPDRMVWLGGRLWVKSQEGVSQFEPKAGVWKWLYSGRSVRISAGTDRILLVEFDRRTRRARWVSPDTSGAAADIHEIISAPDLLLDLALESPNAFWFVGRGQGTSAGHELQCLDKSTGRMMTINEAAGPPFSMVHDAIWFENRLWLATTKGLVTVDAVRFPGTAATKPTTLPATRQGAGKP